MPFRTVKFVIPRASICCSTMLGGESQEVPDTAFTIFRILEVQGTHDELRPIYRGLHAGSRKKANALEAPERVIRPDLSQVFVSLLDDVPWHGEAGKDLRGGVALVDRIIYLRRVDLFSAPKMADLALIASLAVAQDYPGNEVVMETFVGGSMITVIAGRIQHTRGNTAKESKSSTRSPKAAILASSLSLTRWPELRSSGPGQRPESLGWVAANFKTP